MSRVCTLVLLVACGGLLGGCAGNGEPSTYKELGPDANTTGFGDLYPPDPVEGDITFGVGDTILVETQNNAQLTGPFVVRMDGKVNIPVLGEMMAAGLTPEQFKRKLENKVSLYMKDPVISVGAGAIVSKKFFVAAQNYGTGGYIVKQVPYPGNITLFEVWVRVNSPSSLLDDDCHVKVIRMDPRHPSVKVINVREMLVEGRSGGNIQIKPNDVVYFPPTFWGKINSFLAGISLPFTGLFRVTSVVSETDRAIRIIDGSGGGRYGGGYYGGYGVGGGFGGFGSSGGLGPSAPRGGLDGGE